MRLCLETETEPASETTCLFKKLGDGQRKIKRKTTSVNYHALFYLLDFLTFEFGADRLSQNMFYKLIKHKNIVNHIKAQRLSWFGHVQRMPDTRTVKKIFKWNPLTKRSQGRPKYRWEDSVK